MIIDEDASMNWDTNKETSEELPLVVLDTSEYSTPDALNFTATDAAMFI